MKNNKKHALLWLGGLFTTVFMLTGFAFVQLQANVVVAAPTVRLYVAPGSSTITQGKTGNVQIRLAKNTADKVDYVDARVSFSPKYLEVVSISRQGSHFNYSGGPAITYNNANGSIAISGTGALLGTTADVLVATINFKAKTPGTSTVAFTSVSKAGDITNGGRVKNELDGMSNGTVAVSSPPTTTSPSNPTPAPQTPTPADKPPDETIAPGEEDVIEQQGEDQVGGPTDDTTGDDIALTQDADSSSPLSNQTLLYVAAGVGGLLLVGAGGAWFVRHGRQAGEVDLPPIDASKELGIEMPTTDTDSESPVSPEPEMISEGDSQVADPTPQAQPYEVPQIDPLAAALEQSPSASQQFPPEQQPQPQEDPISQPMPELVSPAMPAQPVSPVPSPMPAPTPTAPTYDPVVATGPVAQSPELTQYPAQPITPPVAPSPVAPAVSPAAAANPAAEPVDYANMPDMFDVGEARLKAEGYGQPRPVK